VGLFGPTRHGDNTNLYLGDFNGDGRTDILRIEKGRLGLRTIFAPRGCFSANGDGTFTRGPLTGVQRGGPDGRDAETGITPIFHLGDFNGDGPRHSAHREGPWAADDNSMAWVFFPAATFPDLVSQYADSLGAGATVRLQARYRSSNP
jgi:hypothetical protein